MSPSERLVQRIFASTGEPAVSRSISASMAGTSSGCATLAGLRPPFFSDAAFGLVARQLLDVRRAVANRVRITAEQVGDVLPAAMPQLLRLHRRIPPPVLLGEGLVQLQHVPFDRRSKPIH